VPAGLPGSEKSDAVRASIERINQARWEIELYLGFEQAILMDAGAEGRFSYPADHPLASEFEEQTTAMIREYNGEGEYLCPHHPDEAGAHDDAPASTALVLLAARRGLIWEILVV
jgi:hypothetical protein